jgi:hypothetical protein
MQTAKNWCDGERVKKLGILRWSKHGLNKALVVARAPIRSMPSAACTHSHLLPCRGAEEGQVQACLTVINTRLFFLVRTRVRSVPHSLCYLVCARRVGSVRSDGHPTKSITVLSLSKLGKKREMGDEGEREAEEHSVNVTLKVWI